MLFRSPSGKLPVTFYRNEALDEMPPFTDYSMNGRTYRYYTGTPLYPFGYGLTYGDCRAESMRADREQACVTVRNCGNRATEDVLEIYVRDQDSPLAPPNPVLCGFARVALEAGQSREVRVELDPEAFTVVGEDGIRVPGSGRWMLYAGFGAPDARTLELTGRKCLSLEIRAD